VSEGIQPEVVLNELGELSRKSRRELIAHGIDPDTAVVEHIRTQSIPVATHSPGLTPTPTPEPLSFADLLHGNALAAVPPAPVAPAAVVPPVYAPPVYAPAPLAEPSVFSTSLSRRDVRNLRERSENAPESPVSFDDSNDGLSELTAAGAISDSIASRRRAIRNNESATDQRENSAEIRGGYEAFSISTMSTQSTGIIPTTGSALILPTLPEHAPGAVFSFDQTGEILLTGSISLPTSIGQYGADVLTLDTSDVDMIADDVYKTSSSQHLAPVRATNAVSAYSTSNTATTVPSRFRDRLPFILAITAAGLAVGVVALFITGYVLGVF
jgi:hypothetical protein